MRRQRRAWATVGVIAAPVGSLLARSHLIGPNPWTFFALGALATLAIGGTVHGFREGLRVARSGELISN